MYWLTMQVQPFVKNSMNILLNEYRYIMDVNVLSLFALCTLSFPYLKNGNHASVINIASVAGIVDVQSGAPYGSSKGAVIQFTRNMAAEWAEFGIRVNAVSPWYTDTPLAAPVLTDPERLARVLARTPLGRVGRPEELPA
jgi:NAD(P)-dependent dehydrogenase (short-subunit alcohol dehydrogenase family)